MPLGKFVSNTCLKIAQMGWSHAREVKTMSRAAQTKFGWVAQGVNTS